MKRKGIKQGRSRSFIMSDEIDSQTAGDVIAWIYDVNQADTEKELDIVGFERKPMELIINSFGGSVYDTLAIINAITTSKTKIITTNIGSAFSGALYILAAGHIRLAAPLSSFMYHELSFELYYTYKNKVSEEMQEMSRVQTVLEDFLISKSGIKKNMIQKHNERRAEWFFGVDEALKYKIIDGIYTSVQ